MVGTNLQLEAGTEKDREFEKMSFSLLFEERLG
jgi:hypothetical protein